MGKNLSKKKEDIFLKALRKIAPGTELRNGLDLIISGRTGALIVIGDNEEVLQICNGGFGINAPFSSHRLFELAKMDGAIIIDENVKKILLANVHLVPDPSLPTSETGMRHRTAERVARQTKSLVISISQKRDVVSVYIDDIKYILEDIDVILSKANQALQTLEKYRTRLEQVSSNLSALEFENLVTLADVVNVAQRGEMVERVAREIERYIIELGSEGRLIQMQLDELMAGVEEGNLMLFKDYVPEKLDPSRRKVQLARLTSDQLLDPLEVAQVLGYKGDLTILEQPLLSRGYRLLRKIPRLPLSVVNKIVDRFHDLKHVLEASVSELDDVEGVGEVRAKAIQEGLRKLKEYNLMEKYL